MFKRSRKLIRVLLSVVMLATLIVGQPIAASAADPAWQVDWARDVSDDVGTPQWVSVDADGNYYVVGYTLAKYAPDGSLLWRLNPGNYWEGATPSSVACDETGVYLTLDAGWLFKFTVDGDYVWDERIPDWSPSSQEGSPKVETFDGTVYVTIDSINSISEIDPATGASNRLVEIGTDPNWPMFGLEVGEGGYWVPWDNHGTDTVYHAGFGGESVWSNNMVGAQEVARTSDGTLYVAYNSSRIAVLAGETSALQYEFWLPDPYGDQTVVSLDVDSSGDLYAVVPATNEVVKLSPEAVAVETQTIDNGIVKMTVTPEGRPSVYVWDGTHWIYQYYSEDSWGTVLHLDGVSYGNGYLGTNGGDFTPASNEIEVLDGGRRIVTVYDAADTGIRVKQTFTIMDGDRYVTKDWVIENQGGNTFESVRLYHGGDTYFGGEDDASSYYDLAKSMVYVRNNEFTDWGIMGFYANPATPADHYFSGGYSTGNSYAEDNEDLPDTADPSFEDAGYYLQWNKRGGLTPSGAWHIQAYEVWTPPGALQVLAPGSQNVLPGSSVVLPFTLHNISQVPQDVTLSVECDDPAWTVEIVGGTTPNVGAIERIPVDVRVTVPEDAASFANITLRADGSETSGAGSTRLSVADVDFTILPSSDEIYTRPGVTGHKEFTITNNSAQPLVLGALSFSDAARFDNGEGEGDFAEIAPGDSTTFAVHFAADSGGPYYCTVSVPILSPALVTATIEVIGILQSDVTLTYRAGTGGSIDGSATQVIAVGSDGLPVTAVPDYGYKFVGWSDGVETAMRIDTAVDADLDVEATFERAETAADDIDGRSRYETAVRMSQEAFPEGASSVVVATGAGFADALGGSALAGVLDAPVLLTQPDMLLSEVAAEIERLGADEVYILGREKALYEGVYTALMKMPGELSVHRIGGADRYETAELVAAKVVELQGGSYDGTAFVATGENYADALAASPLAAANGWPVYLAAPPVISDRTIAAMDDAGVSDVILLGGDAAMPEGTSVTILQAGFSAVRIDGVDRYETAAKVAAYGVSDAGMSWARVGLATGETYADALAGGPVQGRLGSVMLLTRTGDLPGSTRAALEANSDDVLGVRFLGGTSAISQSVRDAVMALF